MDRKKVLLLVGALLIAALTAFMARSMFTGASAPKSAAAVAPVQTGPMVLVANRALPVGTLLTADSVQYQPWPKEMVEQAYFIEGAEGAPSLESLVGTVVRNPITAGQPVTQESLVKPGDRGFLAAALSPGMRAVTIPVSALTGVAGFVFPGDRIDLVLTQKLSGNDGPDLKVSETIIRNLRVLATDQRAAASKDEKGNTIVSKYKLVTLEATPGLAEKITVAQTIGTLSLSLRSLADNAAELEQALASGDVKIPEGATKEQEDEIIRSVAARPTSGKSSFATGGEVSRFQRSTIPAQTPIAQARVQATQERVIEKIKKGPIVRVSRAGAVSEVELDRR